MSMPVDCDYFSLGGIPLLAFSAVIISQLEVQKMSSLILGPLLEISLLSIPVFYVNSDREALSYRFENLGEHVFKSYWIRSAGDINAGIAMMPEDKQLYQSRYKRIISDLEPFALLGNDTEYAVLVWTLAKYCRVELKDYKTALYYHELSQKYDPKFVVNYLGLMESCFKQNRFIEAYNYSLKLVEHKHPNEERALSIGIHCALSGELYEEALALCNKYLNKFEDEDIRYIKENLEMGRKQSALKAIFE